jgi:hypothetical protein
VLDAIDVEDEIERVSCLGRSARQRLEESAANMLEA